MAGKRKVTQRGRAGRAAGKYLRRGVAAGLVALGACDTFTPGDRTNRTSAADPPVPSIGASPFGVPVQAGSPISFAGRPALQPTAAFDAGSAISTDLSADMVPAGAIARNVLYSWTTAQQVAELRADAPLFTRSETSAGLHTNLRTTLSALAQSGDPLAELLSSTRFQKGRYAWSNAWATLRGWPDESYGTELVRIVLKPEAWIVTLTGGQFGVVDLNNQPVDVATALASPERIAATYFINDAGAGAGACGTFTSDCVTGTYREYFLNNDQMVREWSLRTPEILSELQRSLMLVQSLRDQLAATPLSQIESCNFSRAAFCSWTAGPNWPSGPRGYVQALALSSAFYVPTVANMDDLQRALKDSLFTPDPFIRNP
jgi:hypothetical protein